MGLLPRPERMTLHLEKAGLRALGIAESFERTDKRSTLAGVIMRGDLIIDGIVLGSAAVSGDDATASILDMIERLGRSDISYILISGTVISGYNVIDAKKIHKKAGVPVINVSRGESDGITDELKRRFPESDYKIRTYEAAGERTKVVLHTSHEIHIRCEGCTLKEAVRLLDGITHQGGLPEPLRVAGLVARAAKS